MSADRDSLASRTRRSNGADKSPKKASMKLPIIATDGSQGKSLEFDPDASTLTLRGPHGEALGTIPLQALAEFIRATGPKSHHNSSRAHERAQVAIKVRYVTEEGKEYECCTTCIGGGGLFIETGAALPIDANLTLEFTLPDRPQEPLTVKGRVVWVRSRTERFFFPAGMGVEFTDLPPEARGKVDGLILALNRARQT